MAHYPSPLPPDPAGWLGQLAERYMGAAASDVAGELLALLRLAEVEATGEWWAGELALAAEALAGPVVGQPSVGRGRLAAEVGDMVRLRGGPAAAAARHGLDEEAVPALLQRLARLTPAQDWAVRDALAEWWQRDLTPDPDGFAALGFATY